MDGSLCCQTQERMYLLTEHSRVKVPPSATLPLRFRGATEVIWKTSPLTATAEIAVRAVNTAREVLVVVAITAERGSLIVGHGLDSNCCC